MSSADSILQQLRVPATEESDADQEGWMVSYADLITLLFIFFSMMLSISSVSKAKFDMLNRQLNQQSTTSLGQIKTHLDEQIQSQNLSEVVKTEMTDEGLQIQFSERVLFGSGDASISPDGMKVLRDFSKIFAKMEAQFHLAIEGHTDSRPIHTTVFPSNWTLSSVRAVNVLHFFSQNGVDQKKMMIRAYADTRPLLGKDNNAQNRRVTLLVF